MIKKTLLFQFLIAMGFNTDLQAQWVQKQAFPGVKTETTAFSVNNAGYYLNGDSTNNFWKFDPAANTWTAMADFPGARRDNAVGFAIGSTGYIVTGAKPGLMSTVYNDMWAYNVSANTWTKKDSLPSDPRAEASGFVINGKAYVGGGWHSDFWEYDPGTGTWTQKANMPMGAIRGAVSFAINGKGYVGTGDNGGSGPLNEFWQYDPLTNTWTQKADFAGSPRDYAAGFALNGKGYIGTGYESFGAEDDDLWEYDPVTNAWTKMPDMGADGRFWAQGLAIGNKGYMGLGSKAFGGGGGTVSLHDMWEFTPVSVPTGVNYTGNKGGVFVYPNPSSGTLYIDYLDMGSKLCVTDILGKIVLELNGTGSRERTVITLGKGIYLATVTSKDAVKAHKLIVE